MTDLFAGPDVYTQRHAANQQVVPTTYDKTSRDLGQYQSADLPNLDRLLDRTLNAIEQSHNYRERSSRSFDALWQKVCKGLKSARNAKSFECEKNASLVRNREKILELEKMVNVLWAKRLSHDRQDDPALRLEDNNAYEEAKRLYADLKPKVRVTTDDILEVAIAYWIEAKNARDSGDDLRCLHALIECWTNIGATRSTKTESEAKSDAGAKQGKQLRNAIAAIATKELRALKVTSWMTDPTYLLSIVVSKIQSDPLHAPVLMAYDAQAIAGKKVNDNANDRIVATLMRWATAKKPSYPYLAIAYKLALDQASQAKVETKK
jgi:hypothetical protein